MQSRAEHQLPRLSAVLNNCPVHALTPEIKNLVLALGGISHGNQKKYDAVTGGNYPAYELLKTTFAIYYGINTEEFNWQDFSRTLQRYNAWDVQHVLGPVLRKFMANYVPPSEIELTQFNRVIGRYNMLRVDDVARYLAFPLGFQINQGIPPDSEMSAEDLEAVNADLLAMGPHKGVISQIVLFHNDSLDAGAGHFERTDGAHNSKSFDPEEKQLSSIMSLVTVDGDPLFFDNGLALLKLDVQTAFKSQDPESYLINTKVIKEAAKKMEAHINQITLTEEFLDLDKTKQSSIKDELSRRVTFEIQQLTDLVATLPTVHLAGSAYLAAKGHVGDSLNAPRAAVAAVAAANQTSPGVTEKAAGAAASSTPTELKVKVVAEGVIPNYQAGASASGAQTPDSKQLIGTALLHKIAGTASAAVGPTTTTSASMGTESMPTNTPVAPLVSPPPKAAAVTSSTLTTRSATATSTTKTTPQSDGKTVSPRRATPTEDQDTKAAGHQEPASAFTPITADQTAAVPEPSTREAPSASLILETALASCKLVTPIEKKLLADQTSHGTTENFQKMVIDLIIIHRVGALVDPKYLAKDSSLLEREKEIQERQDLEIAKQAQKEEFDTYYRNHR